ncbi:type IV secretion protein Rhs [Bacteroidia bacterium]|nr:type IV secretion protein Rhs [Bacteroidia bacterium]
MTINPLCEKYYAVSPYAYCLNNPINAIDPDGRKIIFVNGYLGFGSPSGGATYWGGANSAFVQGAKTFFNDANTPVFTDIGHGKLSTSSWRRSKGYDYAKENYASLIDGMKEGETFKLVSHSMGGAFSDGVMKYLKEQGWDVDVAVYFNAWSPTSIEGSDGTILVDATVTNDWVQALSHDKGNINIPNANYTVRKKSNGNWDTVHRDLIDSGDVWKTDGSVDWNRAMSILQDWLQQNPNIKVTYQ